jgi:hypothetical protein
MPAPLKPHLYPVVLHDVNAIPIDGTNPFPIVIVVVPGTTITSPADTAVGAGNTVALPTPPVGTTRMTIEVTDGDEDTTRIRVREVGGTAGAGRLLKLLGSTMYGGVDGAIAPIEVENTAGPDAAVSISFEGP